MQASSQQLSVIDAPLESQRIIAGPGSGKTYVLTERMISLLTRNEILGKQCLGVTFAVEASLELKKRLHKRLGSAIASTITIKTIHALSLNILKNQDPRYKNLVLCQKKKQQLDIVERALSPFRNMPLFPKEFRTADKALWEMGQYIRMHPDRLMHYNDCSWPSILTKAMMNMFVRSGFYLFDFLCFDALQICSSSSFESPFSAIFVDEFQDLTPVQFHLIQKLSPSAKTSLTIVGDPNQAIYGWRGGSPELFQNVLRHHSHMKTYPLTQSFRCPQKIVDIANHLISHNKDEEYTHIETNISDGIVEIHRYQTFQEELQATATRIQTWLSQDIPSSSIAVLMRTSEHVQQAMIFFHQHNLPVQGESPLKDKEGNQILALLQFLHDGSQLEGAINIGNRRLRTSTYRQLDRSLPLYPQLQDLVYAYPDSYASLQAFINGIKSFNQSSNNLFDSLNTLFSTLSIPQRHSDIPAQDRLFAVSSLVLQLAQNIVEIPALINIIQEMKNHDFRNPQSLLVTTLHKSKGREFSHVCILGNQNNIFPHFGLTKNDPIAIAEERRLLYVGITRTKQELHLSNHSAPTNELFSHRDGFLCEVANITI
ncbi:MAG: hypothetical protein CL916_04335 [Deltaproteobacteria bacterium]|nr:hypothetical protein [Deltaproteobacteria bacterium]